MVSFVQEAASRIPAVIQFGKDVQPSEGWIRIFKQSDREPESAFYCSIYCMFSENTTGFTGRCQDYAKSCFVIRDHSETTKAKRILAKTLPSEEWRSHAINDTRYISKFLNSYIRENLKFDDGGYGQQKVVMPTGAITSFLRRFWRIPHKNREADCLHHAVDATIIACIDQATIYDCASYSKAFTYHQKHIAYEQSKDSEIDVNGYSGSRKFIKKLVKK